MRKKSFAMTALLVVAHNEVQLPISGELSITSVNEPNCSIEQAADAITSILDLIGRIGGTDRGDGYNETFAYGVVTQGDVNLKEKMLAEIEELQTRMLSHPDNRWNSAAVGRYQIVRITLRALKKRLGIADTARFTPELQDRLAIELLKGCGFETWNAGHISDREFALELSKKWASLPNPDTGKGCYFGECATVDYATVAGVLNQVRHKLIWKETSVVAPKLRTATLNVTKSVDDPIKITFQVDFASFHDWNIAINAEYDFETGSYKIGGSVTYKKEDLSISFNGAHGSNDGMVFKVEVKYHF